jgi:hypothetical protein
MADTLTLEQLPQNMRDLTELVAQLKSRVDTLRRSL